MTGLDCIRSSAVAVAAAIVFGPVASPVSAQESDSGENGAEQGIEEVVVTARRRAERLIDVPVSVQAFSSDDLQRLEINDFSGIAQRTPGMVYSTANGVDQEVFIRGIGSDIQGAAVDSPVGFFVDGIYMSRNSGALIGLYDLERVEVLKGPQSLRFGKNIVGGLINYVTKKPTDEFEGSFEISYGDYDLLNVSAAARGPVTDQVSFSLTGVANNHSGYGDNTRGGDAESLDQNAIRGQLRIDASEDLTVLLAADYNRVRATPRWVDIALAGDSTAVTFNSFFAPPIPELPGFVLPDRNAPFDNPDPRSGPRNLDGADESDIYGGSVKLDWSPDDEIQIESITAYRESDTSTHYDGCGMYWDHPFTPQASGLIIPDPSDAITDSLATYLSTVPDCWFEVQKFDDVKQLSQEVRLSWDRGSARYSLGVYYLDEDISRYEQVAFSFPDFNVITEWAFSRAFGGTPSGGVDTEGFSNSFTQSKATNTGVFGEVEFDISDTLTLNVGARWARDEKDFEVTRSGDSFDEPICEPDGGGVLPPGCTVAGRFTTADSESWDEVLPSISLRYQPAGNQTYYVRYEEGYKPGGYTGEGAGTPASALVSFDPEFSKSFEIGNKLLLADNRVQLNLALYYTDYEDLQTQQFVQADPSRPPDNFVVNATGGTEAYGLEADVTYAATDMLTLYGNYAYTKCEFSGELIVDNAGTDIDGNTCRRTPEHGINVGADLAIPVAATYEFSAGFDYQWKDEYFFDNENSEIERVDSEYTLNLRAGLNSLDGVWDLKAWMKNATDELNTRSVFVLFGTKYLNYQEPRTYGITYSRRF